MNECAVDSFAASSARSGGAVGRLVDWMVAATEDEHPDVRTARLRTLPDTWLLYALGLGWSVGAALIALVVAPAWWAVCWLAVCSAVQAARGHLTRRYLRGEGTERRHPDRCLIIVSFLCLVSLAPGILALVAHDRPVLVALGIILTLGWMSYVASLLSAFPRMAVTLLSLLALSMAAGLFTSDDLWPIGLMALTFPMAFQVMMRHNHAVVTGALQAEHELRVQAMHDPLTGLPNRLTLEQWFDDRLGSEGKGVDDIAILSLDLDGFKAINDRLGHAAGDELLTGVGERLSEIVDDDDTSLACRLGGDEFVIALGETQAADAVDVAERLIESCARPFHLANGECATVGVSVGIATGFESSAAADGILAMADRAMYRSKERSAVSWTLADSLPLAH